MLGQRTPGPIHLFCRFRNSTQPYYMGTCTVAPEQEINTHFIPVPNDIAGRSVPFQIVQDGEDGIVMASMNRFDYQLIQSLRALRSGGPGTIPTNLTGNANVGSEAAYARGTLVLGLTDFQLIAFNEYAGTASSGNLDLPVGRLFASCVIENYKESTAGTRVLEVALAIRANSLYNQANRTFFTYSEAIQTLGLSSNMLTSLLQ